jgi:hypothetical protein
LQIAVAAAASQPAHLLVIPKSGRAWLVLFFCRPIIRRNKICGVQSCLFGAVSSSEGSLVFFVASSSPLLGFLQEIHASFVTFFRFSIL